MSKQDRKDLRIWLTKDFIIQSISSTTTLDQAKEDWVNDFSSELKLWLAQHMIMQWVDDGMSLDEAKELWSDFQVVE